MDDVLASRFRLLASERERIQFFSSVLHQRRCATTMCLLACQQLFRWIDGRSIRIGRESVSWRAIINDRAGIFINGAANCCATMMQKLSSLVQVRARLVGKKKIFYLRLPERSNLNLTFSSSRCHLIAIAKMDLPNPSMQTDDITRHHATIGSRHSSMYWREFSRILLCLLQFRTDCRISTRKD